MIYLISNQIQVNKFIFSLISPLLCRFFFFFFLCQLACSFRMLVSLLTLCLCVPLNCLSFFISLQLGVIIRSTSSGHIPSYSFILVTMGSTAVLLIGWRALLFSVLPSESKKKDDTYRKGSAFELFEV